MSSDKDIRAQLSEIEVEIKEHTKILASIDKTLAIQAQQLEYHMRRTELAEENLKLLREEFKPVQAQSEFMRKLARTVVTMAGLGASCGGIMAAIYYALHMLGKI